MVERLWGRAGRTPAAVPSVITNLTPAQRRRAESRHAVVQACDTFITNAGLGRHSGAAVFAALYNAGAIPIDQATRETLPTVHANSIKNWRAALHRDGMVALAGRYGRHRIGTGTIDKDPDLRDFVVGLLAAKPHVDAAQIMRGLRARFDDGRALPSYRAAQRWVAKWKRENADVFQAVTDPDAFRSRRGVAFGSASDNIVALNELWELDSTPADVMLSDGRRHAIVGVIDVWSRRAMVLVTPTSRAVAITTLLRRAMAAWGVPVAIKTDNGSDYVSFHMKRALADLAVDHRLCPPYSPDRKPHIERFLGTLSHQFLELLPGYVGHSVNDRKAIENRRSFAQRAGADAADLVAVGMSAADLQTALDEWCDTVYGRAVHSGIDMSPFERAAGWRGELRRIADERALDVLLAEAPGKGHRTVTKKGLRLDGATFIAGELGAYIGRQVHVRYDPTDMGSIYVFDCETGAFIVCAECPERTGIDRRAAAMRAKAMQKAYIGEEKKKLRAKSRKVTPEKIAEEMLAQGRRAAGVVVAMPQQADAHETPALAEAAAAMAEPRAPAAHDPEMLAQGQRIIERMQAGRPAKTDDDLWRRYQALAASGDATPEDAAWMRSFEGTHVYRARQMIAGAFAKKEAV